MWFGISILAVLIIASISDIRKKEIYLWEILLCLGISLTKIIWEVATQRADPMGIVISLLPGVFFILLALLSRQSIGYGDGFLLLCMGPSLGASGALAGCIVAIFLSGIVSGALLVLKKAGRKMQIPFVPFMTIGMGVTLFAKI